MFWDGEVCMQHQIIPPNQELKNELITVKTVTVPTKVDFSDLGDPVKGHLIGPHGVALLKELMADLPVGRYSKEEITAGLAGKFGIKVSAFKGILNDPKQREKYLPDMPYIPSIIKEHPADESGSGLRAVYRGVKDKKELGVGGFGKVKAKWNLDNNEWEANKSVLLSNEVKAKLEVVKHKNPTFLPDHEKEDKNIRALKKGSGGLVERKKEIKIPDAPAIQATQYNISMEYEYGISLKEFLFYHKLSPITLLDIALQIIEQVELMHAAGYIHADIKLENMIYNPLTGKVTLIDVGNSLEMKDGKAIASMGGTPGYIAPEIIDYKKDSQGKTIKETHTYTEKTDIYAVGEVLQRLLGFKPIDSNGDNYSTTLFKKDLELSNFLWSMKTTDPDKRVPLSNVREGIQGLREQFSSVYTKTVGIVNIADFFEADEQTQAALITAMQSVDSVILVDNESDYEGRKKKFGDPPTLPYNILRQRICDAGKAVFIEDTIMVVSDPSLIVDRIQTRQPGVVPHICYFFPFEKPAMQSKDVQSILAVSHDRSEYQRQIRGSALLVKQENIETILNVLKKDLARILKTHSIEIKENGLILLKGKDYAPRDVILRVQLLQKHIAEVERYKTNLPTYHKLFNDLRRFEKDVIKHRSTVYQWAAGKLFIKPKSMRIMRETRKKLEKEKAPSAPKMTPRPR